MKLRGGGRCGDVATKGDALSREDCYYRAKCLWCKRDEEWHVRVSETRLEILKKRRKGGERQGKKKKGKGRHKKQDEEEEEKRIAKSTWNRMGGGLKEKEGRRGESEDETQMERKGQARWAAARRGGGTGALDRRLGYTAQILQGIAGTAGSPKRVALAERVLQRVFFFFQRRKEEGLGQGNHDCGKSDHASLHFTRRGIVEIKTKKQ